MQVRKTAGSLPANIHMAMPRVTETREKPVKSQVENLPSVNPFTLIERTIDMKRLVVFFTMLAVLPAAVIAGSPYKKGEFVGQLGLGVGGLGGFYGSSSLPVISVGLNSGITENISVGGVAGYTQSTFESGIINRVYKWKYTYITIAARGSYHFLTLFEQNDDIDVYSGISLGYNIVSATYDGDPTIRTTAVSASSSYLFWAFHAGIRYYFAERFAVFGELGYGLGYLNVGIAMKM
jgi:hypothetical protein